MRRPSKKVIFLIALGCGALGFVLWLRYGFRVPARCQSGCQRAPSYLNGPGCLSVIETVPNPYLPTPSAVPYVGNVSYAEGGEGGWCIPSYYAFRYVSNDDGSYSALSKWSSAISAGGKLVYAPGTTGWHYGGCNSNTLEVVLMGILDSLPPNVNGYTLNVHRQDQTLDPLSPGKVVGMFYPSPAASPYEVQAWFVDTSPPEGGASGGCC